MPIYDVNGKLLNIVYSKNRVIDRAFDINGNIIFPYKNGYNTQIEYLKNWLVNCATYTANDATYVKERYRMDTWKWVNGATAIACAQSALTYLYLWKHYKNDAYLMMARGLVTGLINGRTESGGFQMYVYGSTADRNIYTGGNSETPINLFRMAEIDTDNAAIYIEQGLISTEYLLSIQNADGSWRTSSSNSAKTAMFTAQAVGAMASGYRYAPSAKKQLYKTAIEKGIEYIQTQLMQSGRIKTSHDNGSSEEWWRPPTSDQAIVIRGLAIAEYYLPDDEYVSSWRTLRKTLLVYLNDCVGVEGAVRNGLGTSGLPNDYYGLTDHVYTTSWAIEAYYYSSLVDDSEEEYDIFIGILDFCAGNLYFSLDNPYINGVIRGAYNVQDGNWDTSALVQDAINEGGAEMVYVGWTMSPILTWMAKCVLENN